MADNLAVLVTGSMRSGTSSLAGSLKILGLHVPQPEVPGVAAQPEGPLRAALGDPVPQAAAARGAHPAERRQPRRGAADRGRRGRRRDGAGARGLAARRRPSRGSSSRTRTPPGWSARGRAARGPPGATCGVLTAIRHPAEVVGLAGPDLGAPARRRDAPGQGDLQRRSLAQRRAGHRARRVAT